VYSYKIKEAVPALDAAIQLPPSNTRISLAVELKYKAPVTKALPSLSTVGLEVLLPKYLSSKVS